MLNGRRAAAPDPGPLRSSGARGVLLLLATAFNAVSLLHLGFEQQMFRTTSAHAGQAGALAAYLLISLWIDGVLGPAGAGSGRWYGRASARSLIAFAGLAAGAYWPALALAGFVLLMVHGWTGYVWLLQRRVNPSLLFVVSFAALIGAGTVGLVLPGSTPEDKPISVVDALFTATSASCVTGLSVRDTGLEFTRTGQVVILVMIQLGGLGVILFGAMVALLFGSTLSLRVVSAMSDTTPQSSSSPQAMRRLVGFAGLLVFGVELVGAALLYAGWPGQAGWKAGPTGLDEAMDRAFHSVFFSVSAFCNAGFGTCATNLEGLRTHWTSHVVIAALIAIGGLGLPLFLNVWAIVRHRVLGGSRRSGLAPRLSLHSKLVLSVTAGVYALGVLGLFASGVGQRGVDVVTAGLDAHFMSVSARTAGFNTMPMGEIGPLGRLSLMVAMFIGGSPASAAGGIKTIVVGVLVAMIVAAAADRKSTHAFGRHLSGEILQRAATLLLLHALICLGVVAGLSVTEAGRLKTMGDIGPFEQMVFESISACSTVGLSLGITAQLSDAGKLVVVAGMFLGRVGSLAFLVGLAGLARRRVPRMEYPSEGVVLS